MHVILPFLSRFLVISGFLADTRPPLVKSTNVHRSNISGNTTSTSNKRSTLARTGREGWPAGKRGAGEAGDGGGGGGHGLSWCAAMRMVVRLRVEHRPASSYFLMGATCYGTDGDAWWRAKTGGGDCCGVVPDVDRSHPT